MYAVTLVAVCLVLALQSAPSLGNPKRAEKLGVKPTLGAPDRTPIKALSLTSRQGSVRTKRTAAHIMTECIFVASEEGRYFYKAPGDSDQVCGAYFLTDPDQIIEIHFEYFDVPCEGGGLVSVVDGWEMNGQYFPSPQDHKKPFHDRYQEICGTKKIKEVFRASQNAALLQYRVPKRSHGFSFTVKFLKTTTPCNILTEGSTDVYTLRNYGKESNCSLTAVFPGKVKILSMSVGIASPSLPMEIETGTISNCDKRGFKDFLQVGGSEGLDTTHLIPVEDVCGLDSKPQPHDVAIFCEATTVRLVSSGQFDNSATILIRQAGEEDILESSLVCGL